MDEGDADQPTVLIVDDEPSVLDTYVLYLSENCDVRTAENGDDVLAHIRDWDEDYRVAMVTAIDPGPDIVDLPFDEYLYMPIDRQQLVETVQQLLLFDKYERLLEEYHATSETYATLQSHADPEAEGASEELSKLADRQTAIKTALQATVDQFADEDIAAAFREAHGAHE